MAEFPTIKHMLRTIYNAQDGLSEDTSIGLYRRAAAAGENISKLEAELRLAFSCQDISWRALLCNEEYEVVDLETERDAAQYAKRLLWDPIFGENLL